MMAGLTGCLLLCVLYLGTVHTSSVPLFCDNINCDEGTMCTMVQSEPCNARFCPPPHAECTQIATKPGVCPNLVDGSECYNQVIRGIAACRVDEDCKDDRKCCYGCCETADVEVPAEPSLEGNPGSCPYEGDLKCSPGQDIADQCAADLDCAPMQKCCATACGSRCKRPISILPPLEIVQDAPQETTTTTA